MSPIRTTTMTISIVVKPERFMNQPPSGTTTCHILCHAISDCRHWCYVNGDRGPALQITARVQFAALVDAVTIHLIKQCPKAHAEPLRGGPAIAARLLQGSRNRPTLRGLDHVPEGPRGRCCGRACADPGPKPGVCRWAEVHRLEDLLVSQHRRPLDRVLQCPYVPRPRLLAQPCDGCLAQPQIVAQPARQLS